MNYSPFAEIQRVPLVALLPDGNMTASGKEALVDSNTSAVVGIVSPSYVLVTNEQVNDLMMEVLQGLSIEKVVDHANSNGSSWTRELVIDDDQHVFRIKGDDLVKTKINVHNGYDGKTAAGFTISAYRQICANGMMGWTNVFGNSIAHIHSDMVDRLRAILQTQFDSFSLQGSLWEKWSNTGLPMNDFFSFIDRNTKGMEVSSKTRALLSEKQAEAIKERYIPILNQYGDDETVWGAYNVLTTLSTHYTSARKGSHLFSSAYKRLHRLTENFYAEMAS